MTAALLGALAIGLSLGLLGSGGSVLTVPVLVYLLGQEEKTAIAGSLLVVGTVAAAGALQYGWRRAVDLRSVLWFGLPGMVGTWLGAWASGFVSGVFQLTVFAVVMLAAAWLMARPPRAVASATAADGGGGRERSPRAAWRFVAEGAAVGVVTGFVGVGGGFLIVPALVLLAGLPMGLAVGTSLVVIALNSFTGFVSHLATLRALELRLDLPTLALVAAVGVVGSAVGRRLGERLPQQRLRALFAVFLVAVGAFILWRTVPGAFAGAR